MGGSILQWTFQRADPRWSSRRNFAKSGGFARSRSVPVTPERMQPGTQRALEFDRIVEAVKGFALTPLGAERLARLQPSTDPRQVANLLAATSETTRYVAARGLFPLRASSELPLILSALAVEG